MHHELNIYIRCLSRLARFVYTSVYFIWLALCCIEYIKLTSTMHFIPVIIAISGMVALDILISIFIFENTVINEHLFKEHVIII